METKNSKDNKNEAFESLPNVENVMNVWIGYVDYNILTNDMKYVQLGELRDRFDKYGYARTAALCFSTIQDDGEKSNEEFDDRIRIIDTFPIQDFDLKECTPNLYGEADAIKDKYGDGRYFVYCEKYGWVNFFDHGKLYYFSNEEVLLFWMFYSPITFYTEDELAQKQEEIRSYIDSLDLKAILKAYHIEVRDYYRHEKDGEGDLYWRWKEYYYKFPEILQDMQDKYILKLLPLKRIDLIRDDDANFFKTKRIIYGTRRYKEEKKMKDAFKAKYNKDEHFNTLLHEAMEKRIHELEDYYETCMICSEYWPLCRITRNRLTKPLRGSFIVAYRALNKFN